MVLAKLQMFLLLSSCNSGNLMHSPTYVCAHILVQDIIIEDNKYLYAIINKIISQLPRTSHYSNKHIEVQYIMGKRLIASHIRFAWRLQGVVEDGTEGVDEDNDDDHARGGAGHRTRFQQCPPSRPQSPPTAC
jgi:hypothetical protein